MLDSDDIEQIVASVVRRLTDHLDPHDARRFVDAATLARLLDVKRDWIYRHADELGGVRLGGPRGRLRFDLATLSDRLPPAGGGAPPARSAKRRREPSAAGSRASSHASTRPVRLIPYRLKSGARHRKKPGGAATPPGSLHTGR